MLRIDEININNINSITNLHLKFQPGVNILCGTNGIGKTTILDCISSSFSRLTYFNRHIRKTVNSPEGSYSLTAIVDKQKSNYFFDIPDSVTINPTENINRIVSDKIIYHNILSRQVRNYSPLRIDEDGGIRVISSYDLIKRWFYRCYFKKEKMSEEKFENFLLAKEVFNKLDPQITFLKATENIEDYRNKGEKKFVEILVKTPRGTINMDFLSSGYKACFCILLGIIRHIEERLNVSVESFDGIVMIDEIDLHLHPEWQTKIIDILKWLIPNAQVIITTHSPHVIQNAAQGEIIPLGIDENNRMFVRDLPQSSEYGYQGWTIEEILVQVMGLTDPRSKIFIEKLRTFEEALNQENVEAIKENYSALKSMIYHRNPLATLLRIQAEEFYDDDEKVENE
ncbi:hypothetical protein COD21_02260 [Bacillus cereus]|uniref:AAA family ATPase n=1 Tax=Bacillus cereus TaxID=1396 RepID=UPI000BFB9FCD|nr:AAA family ATPase [Bacillus cereus]PGU13414.1 hypothetical protein COD21_02260 [Bacillus cereus]